MGARELRGRAQRQQIDVSFQAGSIPRVPRKYPYPGLQNFGTFGDTTPGIVSEAPFTVLDLAHWATDPSRFVVDAGLAQSINAKRTSLK